MMIKTIFISIFILAKACFFLENKKKKYRKYFPSVPNINQVAPLNTI
jgi:hypothetical protein